MTRFNFIYIAFGLLAWVLLATAEAATVKGVRVWRAPDHTRIVFDLDGPVQFDMLQLSGPERVVLDLSATRLGTSLSGLPLANTPVTGFRSADNQGELRLVLDLNTKVQPNSFLLKAHGDQQDRLVLDLYDQPLGAQQVSANTNTITSSNTGAAKSQVLSQSLPPPPAVSAAVVATEPELKIAPEPNAQVAKGARRTIVIAVDAGHGGEDPGASGPGRVREKDVTLAIAKELVEAINRQPGYSGKLTRTGDYFIPLKKRRDIARDMKADLFVSIHADAFNKSSARGASVFALSRNGATSETARFLAQRENEADLIGGVGGISLDDKDEVLAGVLVDLSMTATLNSSLQIGSHVLNSINSVALLHKRHVEQAGFMVLKSPDVPSILVETGFISNPDESRKLSSPGYRRQMAHAVFAGVRTYFNQHPPAGSQLAAQFERGQIADEREHTVGSGDTLSAIALRYGVSVSQLMKQNGMRSSTVKIGQRLTIPST